MKGETRFPYPTDRRGNVSPFPAPKKPVSPVPTPASHLAPKGNPFAGLEEEQKRNKERIQKMQRDLKKKKALQEIRMKLGDKTADAIAEELYRLENPLSPETTETLAALRAETHAAPARQPKLEDLERQLAIAKQMNRNSEAAIAAQFANPQRAVDSVPVTTSRIQRGK